MPLIAAYIHRMNPRGVLPLYTRRIKQTISPFPVGCKTSASAKQSQIARQHTYPRQQPSCCRHRAQDTIHITGTPWTSTGDRLWTGVGSALLAYRVNHRAADLGVNQKSTSVVCRATSVSEAARPTLFNGIQWL